MNAEQPVAELTAAWWRAAADDLAVAERITDLPFACCFHCQQAVEKAIKALLVLHQREFRKLHDLGQLLELLCGLPCGPAPDQREGIEALTRFAVETRYPPGAASEDEAREALAVAGRFLEWAEGQLPEEVIELV